MFNPPFAFSDVSFKVISAVVPSRVMKLSSQVADTVKPLKSITASSQKNIAVSLFILSFSFI